MMSLSMPAAEPSTPAPTYGMSASSSRPWMVPSSPNVPCSTGKITSTLMARSLARRVSAASTLKGHEPTLPVHRFGRDHDRLALGQHRGPRSSLGIASAQVARLQHQLALQQIFRVLGGEPAAFLGDADGNDFIFIFVDGVENGSGREQRDFVLSAAPAE